MTELAACKRGMSEDESCLGQAVNGESSSSDRETDILEDENDQAAPSCNICSLSTENLPEEPKSAPADFTNSCIQQERESKSQFVSNREFSAERESTEKPSASLAPQASSIGPNSEDAKACSLTQNTDTEASSSQEADFASLSLDIDDSIEQLNQLILDLDPTFIPVPTSSTRLSRSTSVQSSGLSQKGDAHLTGWQQQKQISDVTDYSSFWMCNADFPGTGEEPQRLGADLLGTPFHLSSQFYCVDHSGQSHRFESVPATPAFPLSPPTPYVEHMSEFPHIKTGGRWGQSSWTQDSRSFLDSVNHGGSSLDGDLFTSDVSVSSASCPRIFGSTSSVSSSGPLPHLDSCSPPPAWHQQTPTSSQPSTPIKRSTPNALASPRADSSSLNGNLEHSLLQAVEDLGVGGDGELPPLLPEKRRAAEGGDLGSRLPSLAGFSSPHSEGSLSLSFSSLTADPFKNLSRTSSPGAELGSKQDTVKFVQDTSKFWYKPDISRDQAISVLKDKEPGSFIVRDSHSFRGAYGLAMKVATPPPSVVHHSKKVGDPSNELVRHFLIECMQKGVRLKGCPDEPFFGSLTALVCQHSITPLALPCKLILPDRDPFEEMSDSPAKTATNSAAELLKQGAACNVWYLGSVELESLTGHQAVQKATTVTLTPDPPTPSTVVHFKVSAQGITLTDNQRKLFFRRHYAVNTVIFCSLDPQGRRWPRGSASTAKIFGFVARKSQSETENICHLFAEHDPEQPASAIVNFVSKVMIGSHKK
ncbi:si:ch211-191a24.3 [Syngnathus typhle]|uniref:si:ch211-191a24.3 n=1 Tax=Syngnathus typhle TaxID=161592 RepID=UPI002A6B1D3C|nr:si:ch211-191a24.3 [Syngnathus typhle]